MNRRFRKKIAWIVLFVCAILSSCTNCTLCDFDPCFPGCTARGYGRRPPVICNDYPTVIDYSCEGQERDCESCGQPKNYCSTCGYSSCDCQPCACHMQFCEKCACQKMHCDKCRSSFCTCTPCRCANKACGRCGTEGQCDLIGTCVDCGAPKFTCNECGAHMCGCNNGTEDIGDWEKDSANNPLIDQYVISFGDVLEISVFGDEDTLVENVVVAPDGKVYYLFFDGVYAEGKTLPELKKAFEEKLSKWFLSPSVSIIPQFMSNNTITILGRVRSPGLYPLNNKMTLRQAIGGAGGLVTDPEVLSSGTTTMGGRYILPNIGFRNYQRDNYSLKDSFIVRKGKRLGVNFEKLVFGPRNDQDLFLKPGDYIYIATNSQREVFVLGNVGVPVALPYKEGLRLTAAIASAGYYPVGNAYAADFHNVLVIKNALDCPCYIRVDMCLILTGEARDLVLCPGDVVYVPNKRFRFGRELIRLAITSFFAGFFNQAGSYAADQIFNQGGSID